MSSKATLPIKNAFNNTLTYFNQPVIKDRIKNIIGISTFAFGMMEIYDIYQILKGRSITTETNASSPNWKQTAHKVIILCAKISLILSAAVSPPGILIISKIMGKFYTPLQLLNTFGPYTLYEIHPLHPRHLGTIAAGILGLPAAALTLYNGAHWVYSKIFDTTPVTQVQITSPPPSQTVWMTDAKVRLMALFNTITARPILQIGNNFFKKRFSLVN